MTTEIREHNPTGLLQPGCPVDHRAFSRRKTARATGQQTEPAIERDADGVWHVRDYAIAREILRGDATRQAGFRADLLAQMPGSMNRPILYLEGQPHHTQRRQTARFSRHARLAATTAQ